MIQTETTPPVQKDDTATHDETTEHDSFQLLLSELWMEQNEQH
jgi:hypothetical protein